MPYTHPLKTGDPHRLGDYELSGRLGQGGQGVVFLGTRGEETYAIKLLHGPVGDEQAVFMREVELAKHVARFCTAQVLDAGFDDGRPYIVSEFVDGPSLHRQVALTGPRRGGALDRLAVGMATALAAIHRAGIVHRDFKPQNVLLGPDGPRVIDFGLARVLDAAATVSGRGVGTPAYMAPEQITASAVTGAADVFAWGATMCFAANASAPFGQDSVAPVLHRILTAQPDLGGLDGPMRALVESCLDKDPRNRPTSRELLLSLLGDADGVPAEVLRTPPPHILRVLPSLPVAKPEATGASVGYRMPEDVELQVGPGIAGATRDDGDTLDVRHRWQGDQASRVGIAASGALLISAAVLVGVLVPVLRSDLPPQAAAQPTVATVVPIRPQADTSSELSDRADSTSREPPSASPTETAVTPSGINVPKLAGLDRSAAIKALKRAGLSLGNVTRVDSALKIDRVLGSSPKIGASVARGTAVNLQVSAGLAVPSVTGLDRKAAGAALRSAGLSVGTVTTICADRADGQVTQSKPRAGTRVEGGSAVALVVAKGGVKVPSVVGQSRTQAQATLRAAGFAVQVKAEIVDDPEAVDTVLAQDVAAGTCGKSGSSVLLTIGVEGQAEPDPTEPTPTPTPSPSPEPT